MTVESIFKDKNVTIMEDFNSTHKPWVGVSVGDTETKSLQNISICFLGKFVRYQKKNPNS